MVADSYREARNQARKQHIMIEEEQKGGNQRGQEDGRKEETMEGKGREGKGSNDIWLPSVQGLLLFHCLSLETLISLAAPGVLC